MAEANKKTPTKIMDVSQPGKTAPARDSKSVIVTNTPVVDPMVMVSDKPGAPPLKPALLDTAPLNVPLPQLMTDTSETTDSSDAPKSKSLKKAASKSKPNLSKLIKRANKPIELTPEPVHLDASADPEATTSDPNAPKVTPLTVSHGITLHPITAPASPEAVAPQPTESTKPEQAQAPAAPVVDVATKQSVPLERSKPVDEKAPTFPLTAPLDTPKTETTVADAADAADTEREAELAAEAQLEQDAAMEKLVVDKVYFLPIDSVEKRKTKRFIALGLLLSLLLIIAWADIALDAGLIHIGTIKPITHFFSS